MTRREGFKPPVSQYNRPLNPTIASGVYPSRCVEPHSEASQHLTPSPTDSETSPLLTGVHLPVPRIEENIDYNASDKTFTVKMIREELAVLTKYAIPNFGPGYAPSLRSFVFHEIWPIQYVFNRTHLLEYSLVVVSVVSIGHISTTTLAAISLGSMTASVTGYSVIQGLTSALDTVLPLAWTSNQPQLVGLWAQRMSQSIKSL